MKQRLSLVMTVLVIGASMLSAEDPHFGLQGLLSIPSADLRDLTTSGGYGLALTLDWQVKDGHVLRPRLEYIAYREKERHDSYTYGSYGSTSSSRYSVNGAGLGLDYVYYPQGKPEGFWLSAGIQEMRYEIKASGTTVLTSPGGTQTISDDFHDKSKSRLAYAAGLGYDFNRQWGIGLRLTSVNIEDGTFNAYNASVAYRF